jgi:CheY-like chemotaxis protein
MKKANVATEPRILVMTDVPSDAEMVRKLLLQTFKNVSISSVPDKAAADFERCKPDVLVLAFNTLAKAEQTYLGLYRTSHMVHALTHRSVILCDKGELQRAFELCRNETFDDYVLFWPMVHDAPRLAMSVIHALRDMDHAQSAAAAAEMARMVRRIAELEGLLKTQFEVGQTKAEAVSRSVDHDVAPLKKWIEDTQCKLAPHLAATHAVCEMASHFQPVVLVVDDHDFEFKLVEKLMEEEFYELIYANSGALALRTLRKRQADLILMDLEMPDMDGLETLRRLKASPQFAGIPVMMVTGQSGKEMVVDCLKAGAVDFVVKPLERELFLKKVARFLRT